jgi:hypothetical protein
MSDFMPLTQVARQALRPVLEPGRLAVDATVGNGHDTLFLAGHVAPGGRIIGFDVQPQALAGTRIRLQAAGLASLTTLHLRGHEHMRELIPSDWTGKVSAVMFNLGYLPGGDKTRTTAAATTLDALDQALSLLRVRGLVSLLVYRGHTGAEAEAKAVRTWLDRLNASHRIIRHESPGPVLYLVERLA